MKYFKIIIDENADKWIGNEGLYINDDVVTDKTVFSDILHDDGLNEQETSSGDDYGFTLSEKAKDVFVKFEYKTCLLEYVKFENKEYLAHIKSKPYHRVTMQVDDNEIDRVYHRIQFYGPNPTYVQSINFPKSVFKKRAKGTVEEHVVIYKDYVEYLYAKIEYEIKFEKLVLDKKYQNELGDLFYFEKTPCGYYPNNEILPNGYKNENKAICSERLKNGIEVNQLKGFKFEELNLKFD